MTIKAYLCNCSKCKQDFLKPIKENRLIDNETICPECTEIIKEKGDVQSSANGM